MAKKTKQPQPDEQQLTDDDLILWNGIQKIRQGILNTSWDEVCDGYNSITGESLVPVRKPTSRLQKIRQKVEETTSKDEPKQTENSKIILPDTIVTKEPVRSTEDGVKIEALVTTQQGKLKIISDEFNAKEAKQNQKTFKPRPPVQVRNNTPKTTTDENADVRFSDKPSLPPPWR